MDRRLVVTGCAGFIGSNLVDRLLASGREVVGVDDFSTGQRRFIASALRDPRFRLIEADLLAPSALTAAFAGADFVFHLAANADVRFGTEHPRRDLEQNTIATYNVLEAMRANGVRRIAFSSTGSVYGEPEVFPTPEDAAFPIQTSLYGASKAAGEALIAAYCEGFGFRSWIFRFVSILGERYTHGHVVDFYRQLRSDPTRLRVLGNGRCGRGRGARTNRRGPGRAGTTPTTGDGRPVTGPAGRRCTGAGSSRTGRSPGGGLAAGAGRREGAVPGSPGSPGPRAGNCDRALEPVEQAVW